MAMSMICVVLEDISPLTLCGITQSILPETINKMKH